MPQPAHAQSLYREIEEPKRKPVGRDACDPRGRVAPGSCRGRWRADQAERFADEGWLVWNVDGSGSGGYDDIEYWYRTLRKKASGPLCVYGGSAGANFALVLAARESVDCVIADAPATDLAALLDPVTSSSSCPASAASRTS